MVDLEENGFVVPEKCKEAIEQYRRDVNPTKVFLEENYRLDPQTTGASCGGVYSTYVQWCGERGYKPMNEANLGKEIRSVKPFCPQSPRKS